jgi:hypothetical protein
VCVVAKAGVELGACGGDGRLEGGHVEEFGGALLGCLVRVEIGVVARGDGRELGRGQRMLRARCDGRMARRYERGGGGDLQQHPHQR